MNLKDLKRLGKNQNGKLTLDGKLIEGQKVGEIKVEEPIENILSSRGNYNPLRCREQQIPPDAKAYFVEEIACVMRDPSEVGITDYKVFRVEFYKDVKESYPTSTSL